MTDFEKLVQAVQDDLAKASELPHDQVLQLLGFAQTQALLAIAVRLDAIASYYETMTERLASSASSSA